MSRYKRRYGDRKEGRLLRSLPAFARFLPYIMPRRSDAIINYEESFEINSLDRRLRQLRVDGYKGIGIFHFIIAAYIRALSMLPGVNRFIVGRRIYARDDIDIVMSVRRNVSMDSVNKTVKVHFAPTDTIFDVYRKLNEKLEQLRTDDENSSTEDFLESLSKAPRPLLKLVIFIFRVMDYFGWAPESWLELSPFHGSMMLTDLSSLRIDPVFRSICSFGTLPVYISIGAKHHKYELNRHGQMLDNKYIDAKISIDGRIADGQYYAQFLRAMRYMFEHPEIVEHPPTKVVEDIY